jgi:hypothetical protein
MTIYETIKAGHPVTTTSATVAQEWTDTGHRVTAYIQQ